jgi:hypothetical protein
VAYLVRSFQTNARIRSLTTGTFNRVVKDRIAIRRSGADSVQANSLQERIRLSSKPYNHTVLHKTLSTRALHRISTRFPQRERSEGADWGAKMLVPAHDGMAFRFEAHISAQGEAEDRKLRKELTFGGPCLEGTLQKPTLVSESSPVAGAIQGSNPCLNFRCRTRTRVAEMRPASHTNALGSLFIPIPTKKCKP